MFEADNQPPISTIDRKAELDQALASFNKPAIQGTKVNTIRAIPGLGYSDPGIQIVDEEENSEVVLEGDEDVQEANEASEEDQQTEETEESLSPEFAAEFTKAFGIPPEEAVETFNQLVSFRNEVMLMQEWGVTPVEYRQRMTQVKEFYQELPEDGREQFNTPEGAMAIWNHLSQTSPKQTTRTTRPASRTAKAPKSTKPLFTSEQIVKMSEAEFKQNAAAIQRAYLEGRVK